MSLFSSLSFCLEDLDSFISVAHALFFISFFPLFLCLKALFLSMSHFFFVCVSFSPSLLQSFAQHSAYTPSHGRDTCAMLHNTQKASLNGIGT
jgi:hypothetical protein